MRLVYKLNADKHEEEQRMGRKDWTREINKGMDQENRRGIRREKQHARNRLEYAPYT